MLDIVTLKKKNNNSKEKKLSLFSCVIIKLTIKKKGIATGEIKNKNRYKSEKIIYLTDLLEIINVSVY